MTEENIDIIELAGALSKIILEKNRNGLRLSLTEKENDKIYFNAEIAGRATWRDMDGNLISNNKLRGISFKTGNDYIEWTASLGVLRISVNIKLLTDSLGYEEAISVSNISDENLALEDLSFGPTWLVCGDNGSILTEFLNDRWMAVPFGKLAGRPRYQKADFPVRDILAQRGTVPKICNAESPCGRQLANGWFSEGWICRKDLDSLLIFHFNQESMSMGRLEPEVTSDGVRLCFGGYSMWLGGPPQLKDFKSGASINLGIVRYESGSGCFSEACLAYRKFLSEHGCGLPKDFDPPVQWDEIFDTDEWHGLSSPDVNKKRSASSRRKTFSREIMLTEAAKAAAYSCDALYFDPGWDSSFGSLRWGAEWLGDLDEFLNVLSSDYGLGLSLHVCLPTWLCTRSAVENRGVDFAEWPPESFRVGTDGHILENAICPGSKQYIEEAVLRLKELAAKGVRFFMFDGNWYPGTCCNPAHGHAIPYTFEDHIAANLELVRALHKECPDVLIELHPALSWANYLFSPLYYKYGLPESHNLQWGYELMWHPLDYLKRGESLVLYYHILASDIPLYLQIDLRDDNEHCSALWWSASTVRQLGIGGTHADPVIAERQRNAMRNYKRLERFYKRGIFYSNSPEVHVHVLPEENSLVVNIFNLSNDEKIISGAFNVSLLGIDASLWYRVSPAFTCEPAAYFIDKQLKVAKRLPAWGCFLYEITPGNL